MHRSMSGHEYGLLGHWSFDECAGNRVRDRRGAHDGQVHGGRWMRSPVKLFTAKDRLKCLEGEDCTSDEDKRNKLNFEYWQRSIDILEMQAEVGKAVTEQLPNVDDLLGRIKRLEQRDNKRGKLVERIYEINMNTTFAISELQQNLTEHTHHVEEWMEAPALDMAALSMKLNVSSADNATDEAFGDLLAQLQQQQGMDGSLGGDEDTDENEDDEAEDDDAKLRMTKREKAMKHHMRAFDKVAEEGDKKYDPFTKDPNGRAKRAQEDDIDVNMPVYKRHKRKIGTGGVGGKDEKKDKVPGGDSDQVDTLAGSMLSAATQSSTDLDREQADYEEAVARRKREKSKPKVKKSKVNTEGAGAIEATNKRFAEQKAKKAKAAEKVDDEGFFNEQIASNIAA